VLQAESALKSPRGYIPHTPHPKQAEFLALDCEEALYGGAAGGGKSDALIMAAAGLKRIGRAERISQFLSDDVCVSAVAQGALGIETREDDAIRDMLAFLHDDSTAAEVAAERSLLDRLGGGCHVPIGARARVDGDSLTMIGVVASPHGRAFCKAAISGARRDASNVGRALAEQLLKEGAGAILAAT
jgi:hydroxymethylbilane synthase